MDSNSLTALVGATAALAGVLIAQLAAYTQAAIDRKHQRRVLLRQKYEELMEHLNKSLVWADKLISATTWQEIHEHAQPMATRHVYALALLYFPELKPAIEDYLAACLKFQDVLTSNYSPKISATAGAQAFQEAPEASKAAGSSFQKARIALDKAIERYASKYAAA